MEKYWVFKRLSINKLFQGRFLYFFVVVLVLIIVRFVWLDKFPVGIDHDQADMLLSAVSYKRFGTDISGVAFPKSLFINGTQAGQAGLPSFIISPFVSINTNDLVIVRVPFVVINIITIFLLAILSFKVTKNKSYSKIVLLVSLINPWLFYFSRLPTEATFALMFILAGVISFYLDYKYGKILSNTFFVLAYFSYFGAKPLVPLIILLFVFLELMRVTKRISKEYLFSTFLSVLIIIFSAWATFAGSSTIKTRGHEISFLNTQTIESDVNYLRKSSIENSLKPLFINKATLLIKNVAENYFGWMNSDFLFFSGDASGAHRFAQHGVLYVAEIIFLIAGLFTLGKVKKLFNKVELLSVLLIFFIIAPVASAISVGGGSYIFRSFLLIPSLILLISLGIFYVIETFSGRWKLVGILIITSVYLLSFANFLFFYFNEYPVLQQENYFLSERILANYLVKSNGNKNNIVVVVKSSIQVFQQYVLYSDYLISTNNLYGYHLDEYSVNNILFTKECPDSFDLNITYIVQDGSGCNINTNDYLVIQNQRDAGSIFKIVNDNTCSDFKLDNWRRFHLVDDYQVERLGNERFCNRWIAENI